MLYRNTITAPGEMRSAITGFLENLSENIILNEETEFKIKIIVSELVTNCFRHEEAGCFVHVLGKPANGCISIALLRDGPGFNISAALSSCCCNISEENRDLKETGRGLHIVSVLSDVLRYNRRGNIIAIKVNLV